MFEARGTPPVAPLTTHARRSGIKSNARMVCLPSTCCLSVRVLYWGLQVDGFIKGFMTHHTKSFLGMQCTARGIRLFIMFLT